MDNVAWAKGTNGWNFVMWRNSVIYDREVGSAIRELLAEMESK